MYANEKVMKYKKIIILIVITIISVCLLFFYVFLPKILKKGSEECSQELMNIQDFSEDLINIGE